MKRKKKTILVTGATGNLGAYLIRHLLLEGATVYALARDRRKESAGARIKQCLASFGDFDKKLHEYINKNLIPFNINITDSESVYRIYIPDGIDETWHVAASLKYMPKDIDEIYSVNINALNNVIQIHKHTSYKDARFFYVSTAYVGGNQKRVVHEKNIPADENMSFNNEYERTKLMAENIIMSLIDSGEVQGNIFRPSIVVGDKQNGKLLNYYGYYVFVKPFLELKKHLYQSNSKLDSIRIQADPKAKINLIPIDDAISIMLKIRDSHPENGMIFNVVNGYESTLGQVIEVISSMVGYSISAHQADEFIQKPKNRYEKILHYGMDFVLPYINQKIEFDTTNIIRLLGYQYKCLLYPWFLEKLNKCYINRETCR